MTDKRSILETMPVRLRAVMEDMDIKTARQLADRCGGATAGQVSNWLNGYHIPPVPYMVDLARAAGVTLDWLYSGDDRALGLAAQIRLMAIMNGMKSVEPEPEPKPSAHKRTIQQPNIPTKRRKRSLTTPSFL